MSRNQILLGVIVAALLALGAAAWFIMGKPDTDPTAGSGSGGGPVTTADDRTLGDPKAPAVVIEYAAPMCPHCKRMNEEGIPDLKANYIDKGKVFYIFRVFPIGAADVPAETLARCLPKESYFPFIDLLYSKQESWDPEYGITDVQGGLIALARIAGLTSDQALACMNDKAKQARRRRRRPGRHDPLRRHRHADLRDQRRSPDAGGALDGGQGPARRGAGQKIAAGRGRRRRGVPADNSFQFIDLLPWNQAKCPQLEPRIGA
ncbi:MAG: thioredoxin domain-containing protein [Rhizomicrobium sp.]